MRLVIAEKRSVAFAIAQALGDVRQGDGYVSAGGALISWAQGHLVELSDPEEYTDMPWSARKWTMESLPIDPKSWRWRLSGAKGAVQRYRSLVELLRSDKVTELVNACDPDREGEAIFRRILMAAKISKPSLRLWVASLDEQAIRDAWKRMRPESDLRWSVRSGRCEGEGRLAGRYERVTRPYARLASQSVARTRAHTNVEHGRPT